MTSYHNVYNTYLRDSWSVGPVRKDPDRTPRVI